MEFIKNIFKKIKEFFTIHERVRLLEIRQRALDSSVTALRKRIEMLEFKAKGMTYYCYRLFMGSARSHWVVEYARPTHIARVHLYNETGIREPEINDDFLEFYENGKIARVYVALDNDDALVDVDLDLYKKAYPERFDTQGTVYVNTCVATYCDNDPLVTHTSSVRSATDALSELVNSCTGRVRSATDALSELANSCKELTKDLKKKKEKKDERKETV